MHDMEQLYRHIIANPEFHALRKRRSRFSWTLLSIVLGSYYAFIFVVAFKPSALAVPLHSGTVITWGIPVGLSIIMLCIALTAFFVSRANNTFDPATRSIIDAAERACSETGSNVD
jgi:uncharacterized membrane protein (DUF485 family)